jgi:hypothetical protein
MLSRALDFTYFCRELASHGLLVIALDHMDGSGMLTKNFETGEEVIFDRTIRVDEFNAE